MHRHGRKLAGLPADRRAARQRRDQRLAHRADGHRRGGWDEGLLDLFGVPRLAPCPRSSTAPGQFGTTLADISAAPIPICGMAGDQQAAAIGQACFAPGDTKATYGTGAFVLTHAGDAPPVSSHRLLATVAWQLGGERRYALEGSLFVAGSMMQWLRDAARPDRQRRPKARHWRARSPTAAGSSSSPPSPGSARRIGGPDARGAILGLTLGAEPRPYRPRRAGGGRQPDRRAPARLRRRRRRLVAAQDRRRRWPPTACSPRTSPTCSALDVERPANVETTALGAAMLAGVGAGLFASLDEAASAVRGQITTFQPEMDASARASRIAAWDNAVQGVRGLN